MSTEVMKRDDSADVIGVAKLGDIFAKSGYFRDVRDQAQAVVKILYGKELGFSPVVSMMGIHVIEGKPSLSSNLLGTLVKRSGKYDYRVKESTDKGCVLEFFTRNGDKWESLGLSGFSMEDASRANLVKPNSGWTKYPRAMTFARALSAGVRLHCPDVSACPLYVPEELGATVDEEGAVVELPASARPVAVTQQPITFTKPAAGEITKEDLGVADKGPTSEAEPTNPIPAISPAAPLPDSAFIEQGQVVNLHRTFRDTLPKRYQAKADEILAKILLDDYGLSSSKLIRPDQFFDLRDNVCHKANLYTGQFKELHQK